MKFLKDLFTKKSKNRFCLTIIKVYRNKLSSSPRVMKNMIDSDPQVLIDYTKKYVNSFGMILESEFDTARTLITRSKTRMSPIVDSCETDYDETREFYFLFTISVLK